FSCKKDKIIDPISESPFETIIDVHPVFGIQELYLDSTYITADNYSIQFTDIKFYFSHVVNGSDTLCQAALFDYRNTQHNFIKTALDGSKFQNISTFLGVDASLNHKDPSAFPNDSPLNIIHANDMHW